MSNTIEVQNILNQSYTDFDENSSIYNEIYQFYKNKALSIDDIDLLLLDMEFKASTQINLIDILYKIFIALSVPAVTYLAVKVYNINIIKFIALIIISILAYFFVMKPVSKQIQIDNQERLIYLLTIKALNDLKNEIQ